MSVDEAIEEARQFGEQEPKDMLFAEHVAIELAAEVERLRAELAHCQSLLDETKTELSICGAFHAVAKKEWRLEVEKVNRLEAELAAAKAASVVPVKFSWCYESNGCDIVIDGMSDEDSTKFGDWLNQRMNEV